MIEVTGLLVFIIVIGASLTYLDSPLRNRGRYSGPVFDPQKRLYHRAGAVGYTGVKCPLCGVTTYGNSPRCGSCGRLNVSPRIARAESSAYPVPPSPLASEGPPFPRLISLNTQTQTLRHDPAETAAKVHPTSSLSTATDPSPRGTRRVGGGAAS